MKWVWNRRQIVNRYKDSRVNTHFLCFVLWFAKCNNDKDHASEKESCKNKKLLPKNIFPYNRCCQTLPYYHQEEGVRATPLWKIRWTLLNLSSFARLIRTEYLREPKKATNETSHSDEWHAKQNLSTIGKTRYRSLPDTGQTHAHNH